MRKFLLAGIALSALLAGSASAADLPVKAPYRAPPVPLWSWSGFYIGINGGYGSGSDDVMQTLVTGFSAVPPPAPPFTLSSAAITTPAPKGGFFGAQLGFNWQTGPIVWGVEGDYQGASQASTTVCGGVCDRETVPGVVSLVENTSVYQKVKWFGTVRGRVGWASDGAMIYATAGGAWMGVDETDTVAFSITPGGASLAQAASFSSTRSGYSAGAGIEMRLWAGWTAKVEYLHLDVSGTTNTFAIGPAPVTATSGRMRDDIGRLGLNWKFGPFGGPLMAAY
jgi:outer membrane immunogenic protein